MRFGIFTLDDWDVSGRTVLCRVDINQPVDRAAGTLRSTKRIEACVPTVRELADSAITNLGRYRCRSIPAAGALLKEEDGDQMRLL